MDDQEKAELDYVRGFNEGYIIAQHSPELARHLASISHNSARISGIRAGQEQYQAEQIHTQQKEYSTSHSQGSQAQAGSAHTDVFDQLYRQQGKAEDMNQQPSANNDREQEDHEMNDVFEKLKEKHDLGHKGLDIEL